RRRRAGSRRARRGRTRRRSCAHRARRRRRGAGGRHRRGAGAPRRGTGGRGRDVGVARGRSASCPLARSRRDVAARARRAARVVPGGDADVGALLRRLLAKVVLVADWQQAIELALGDRSVVFVTPDGDRFGGGMAWRAGAGGRTVVTPAALEDARHHATAAETARDAADRALRHARGRLDELKAAEQRRAETLRARRRAVDAALDDTARR